MASGVAAALEALAQFHEAPRIRAVAAWVRGMACQLEGQMELALGLLRQARSLFEALGDPHAAASVQVSLLSAMAILGRSADAIACGEGARAVFVEMGDQLSAGKIEQNLGGTYFRRDQYAAAEQLLRSARATLAHRRRCIRRVSASAALWRLARANRRMRWRRFRTSARGWR
jgi:tetratricopeptide (TPR) repeat protein